MNLPLGFRYAATYAGLRKVAKDDLALIVADRPVPAAAVFTTNLVVAAPVEVARKNLRASGGRVRAWLVNAGNANCATRTGHQVANTCVRATADALGAKAHEILPASTGVIGVEMDAHKVIRALPRLVAALDPGKFDEVAQAMMTTDTRPKTALLETKYVRFAGTTKG
jgi:glutamate N-acetyltransferase/amino-acid N-acetyltransferase